MQNIEWHTIFTLKPMVKLSIAGPLSIYEATMSMGMDRRRGVIFPASHGRLDFDQRPGDVNKFFWLGISAGLSYEFSYKP